jgi:hypothetical protein
VSHFLVVIFMACSSIADQFQRKNAVQKAIAQGFYGLPKHPSGLWSKRKAILESEGPEGFPGHVNLLYQGYRMSCHTRKKTGLYLF